LSTDRSICVHGHFYQPPRENPWLEAIEYQESAYPYHDWNERITAECYGPNTAARILDDENRIVDIVNNYASISFNVGPTLMSWMEDYAPAVYQAIIDADRESLRRFSGHGSAIAQAYNHMIMPLANTRDKRTQVRWGLRDFIHRFGRLPEGMWLPETAVDVETLEELAEAGIAFTILAPSQAEKVRRIGNDEWVDVSAGNIDPTMPYRQTLPSGRSITLFFYDGPISRAVAFEGLLSSGQRFAERLVGGFSDQRTWAQLVHIATDGESYGHHHRWGEMALADMLRRVETSGQARITVYGEHLAKYPPTHEVEIKANTSWSCSHGVERWRSDCGCNMGHQGWNQAWRGPLRKALDELRDTIAPLYEAKAKECLRDPWAARDAYIDVVLDRSPESVDRFLNQHSVRVLNAREKTTALELLEIQRNCMLMYTSCGWFFEEISGIETVQIMMYAGRAIQLAHRVFGRDLEPRFLEILATAKSNIPEHGDGARIYQKFVKPAAVTPLDAGAHYAVSSIFKDYESTESRYHHRFEVEDFHRREHGISKLAVGRARVTSEITWESQVISFGVLHFGDHHLNAGVRVFAHAEEYEAMAREVLGAFDSADFAQVIRVLDKHFGGATYSFKSLFKNEQREVLGPILGDAIDEMETACGQVYEHHAPLLAFLTDIHMPLPRPLKALAELVLNVELRRELARETLDADKIAGLVKAVQRAGVPFHEDRLARHIQGAVERRAWRLEENPDDPERLEEVARALTVAELFPFQVELWRVQNVYWSILNDWYPKVHARARRGHSEEREWAELFTQLGTKLGVRIPE